MTDQSEPASPRWALRSVSQQDVEQLDTDEIAAGERVAGPHDPGPGEEYAGEPVADPWEEVSDGELDPGALPGEPA
jgi:hypothetical protein